MSTVRVSRGRRHVIGEKWGDERGNVPPDSRSPAYLYEPVVKHDIEVLHKAANLQGRKSNRRVYAAPQRVVHVQRFAPGGIPRGVDQNITLPHDCANHLPDTIEVLARGW